MGNGAGSRGRIGLHNTQDLTCGLFFMAVALLGMWFGKDLPVGSPTRLGTACFRAFCAGEC